MKNSSNFPFKFKPVLFFLSSSWTQAKLRLEMEMERQRQTHSKEIESKDEEVEEIRRSCGKKVRAAPFYSCILKFIFQNQSLSFLSQQLLSGGQEKQKKDNS